MDDNRFWTMIEDAWAAAPAKVRAERTALATREPDNDDEISEAFDEAIDGVIARLRTALDALDDKELLAFDRILERRLYQIDRSEIQEVTDGSDDGFLYCRGFIVAMGRRFYEAVDKDPDMALCDAELEAMCYLSATLYEKKFGKLPKSEISRESCSNQAGWPD